MNYSSDTPLLMADIVGRVSFPGNSRGRDRPALTLGVSEIDSEDKCAAWKKGATVL